MKKEYHKLSHTIWLCTYHIIFCPKYRKKIINEGTEIFVRNQLYKLCGRKDGVEIIEINIQPDHVHLIISIPPKYSVSNIMGYLKGKTAVRLYEYQGKIKKEYWGRHIWARGYCVSSVGLEEEKVKKYVKWQQEREQRG